jgi:exosortase
MTRGSVLSRHRDQRQSSAAQIARWIATHYRAIVAAALLLATVLATYRATIADLLHEWTHDANYSVGQLVPFAALYLLWQERRALGRLQLRPCWWGIGLIVLAQAMRFYGLVALYESAERYSLILTIWGVVLLCAGWQVFRHVIWILLFLLLMVPLPGQIHNRISNPLQGLATAGAVFLLELSGASVTHEGNVLVLNDSVRLAVAEACSGLRMLTAFVVVAATLAYVVARPRWQKAVLLVSSIPVAIACNVIRLFVTAQLNSWTSNEIADKFFHDFAGLTMMPLAVLMLAGELWLLDRMVVPDRAPPAMPRKG